MAWYRCGGGKNKGTIKCYIDDSGYWHFTNLTVGKTYNAQIHYGNNSTDAGWFVDGVAFTGVTSYVKASASQVKNTYFDWYYIVSFVPSETEVTFKGTGTGTYKLRPQFLIASEDGTEFGCILDE